MENTGTLTLTGRKLNEHKDAVWCQCSTCTSTYARSHADIGRDLTAAKTNATYGRKA